MPWIEIHVTVAAEHVNELSDQLVLFGAQAVTLQDAGDQPIFEPTPETPRLWHQTIVVGLFDPEDNLDQVIHYLEQPDKKLAYHLKHIPDEDWERKCLDSFKPMRFGKRLWICPSWHTPPDPHAVNIILDPGLAFGTGTHPTTTLCLEWLDKHISSEDVVIDYGCGSGILGIAAIKLGAKYVIAVDNDPQALEATRLNFERNKIDSTAFSTCQPSQVIDKKADILIANILAQPLIELAPTFAFLTKRWNKIVLSGILCPQVQNVVQAYEPWFRMEDPVFLGEWTRLEGIKT